MRLYNTLSRTVEEFQPFKAGQVGLYACGFTVYDYTHIGHLRKYSLDDVLVRTLKHAGFNVKFVQNITDVGHLASDEDTGEDKLEKGAKKYQQSVWDIAHKFEDYFFYSMDLMGNLRPDVSCRATDHIQEQLEMVKTLEKKGFTYVIEGDGVYFDTSKLADYGKLARLDISKIKEGARVEVVVGKRNSTDFALWKFERPGENRAMSWLSPWAEKSFPGWHIECSAMSMKYLGEQFDIHTGGIDHIPVHHTNEIAQAEAATGKVPFVKYWVHHNFVLVNGEKMSKSLNNFFTVDDVLKQDFKPAALRLLFLMTHYRRELNFTWESLAGAETAYDKLMKLVWQLQSTAKESDKKVSSVSAQNYRLQFFTALENDLDTPVGLGVLWKLTDDQDILATEKLALLLEFDSVLGLGLAKITVADLPISQEVRLEDLPAAVKKLVDQRSRARIDKNWAESDQLRQQIGQLGYDLTDQENDRVTITKHKN